MDSEHPLERQHADSPGAQGVVVVYSENSSPNSHESVTRLELARRLAAIKGYRFAGEYDASCRYAVPLYFVPGDTLVTVDRAHALGIRGEDDLFGGVVPFPFVATKTITHPLLDSALHAPQGWSSGFAQRVSAVVLPGFSAFAPEDARTGGAQLLAGGSVRIKKACGIGGLGQWVVHDADELAARLQTFDAHEVLRDGLVLECNLSNVTTHSVGQVKVGELLASYYGVQRLTVNNFGEQVYGGSDLIVVRGDFDALLRLVLAPQVQTAVMQACTYHEAALASFPGMFASRCNYDIAQGIDDHGEWRSGVLEQSWRIGGASGAEVAALEAFCKDPALDVVRASTVEVYGAEPELPADAAVYFCGKDEGVGPIAKYARIESHADP